MAQTLPLIRRHQKPSPEFDLSMASTKEESAVDEEQDLTRESSKNNERLGEDQDFKDNLVEEMSIRPSVITGSPQKLPQFVTRDGDIYVALPQNETPLLLKLNQNLLINSQNMQQNHENAREQRLGNVSYYGTLRRSPAINGIASPNKANTPTAGATPTVGSTPIVGSTPPYATVRLGRRVPRVVEMDVGADGDTDDSENTEPKERTAFHSFRQSWRKRRKRVSKKDLSRRQERTNNDDSDISERSDNGDLEEEEKSMNESAFTIEGAVKALQRRLHDSVRANRRCWRRSRSRGEETTTTTATTSTLATRDNNLDLGEPNHDLLHDQKTNGSANKSVLEKEPKVSKEEPEVSKEEPKVFVTEASAKANGLERDKETMKPHLEEENHEEKDETYMSDSDIDYCDPCTCRKKCCLDIIASIFCVSLL